jgi:succinate-semialdehyde dehydrogenase/glutarate-semialdehyde dehydrogenase
MYPTLGLFIDGIWIDASDRISEPVINPSNGKIIGRLPHATDADLDRALIVAKAAFNSWRAVSAYDRAKIIRKAASLIRDRRDHIAQILTSEQGKLFQEAQAEVDAAADIVEWSAEEGRRIYGRVIPSRAEEITQLMVQDPIGPVAAFTPWNFPASTPARKISGALAAGCSIIIKASEETPATCIEIVKAFMDAGLPSGVLNLVFGVPAAVSARLLGSPIIRKVSFTGSIPVGKSLTRAAAEGMKRVTMELGGHGAALVFPDADVASAVRTLVTGKFRNAGQVCIAPSRLYVHESIQQQFVEEFLRCVREIRVGDGFDSNATMGPLANSRRVEAMESIIADAVEHGGQILCGGKRITGPGYFFEPTVVLNPTADSRLMCEEPFGPIAPIILFQDFDTVIEQANSLPYGLSAYVFSNQIKTAMAAARKLDAGMIAINSLSLALTETPFGGMKESGLGHEGGTEGVEAYTAKKFISLL